MVVIKKVAAARHKSKLTVHSVTLMLMMATTKQEDSAVSRWDRVLEFMAPMCLITVQEERGKHALDLLV